MSRPLVTGVAPRWEGLAATLLAGSSQVHLVRRCADVAELVGVARAGLVDLVLVSSDLRGLDREVVSALQAAGADVVALHPPGDEDGARALRRWGVPTVLSTDASTDVLDDLLEVLGMEQVVADDALLATGGTGASGPAEPESALPDEPVPTDPPEEPGQLIVVWGPQGSHGRTTVAVNLAAELGSPLEPVILVDADTHGASVAQVLAVLDEAPGVAAAARAADQGTLDAEALRRLAPEVRPGLRVLTGLPRADRWPELREASLADVLQECRAVARRVVVDVAPVVEQDEELSFDTEAPRRNGATLAALEAADRVLVVGTGDPVGLQRLVRALDVLREHTLARPQVVVTRVRPGPVGPEPERRIRETLSRFAGIHEVHLVPEDREALDAALLHGRVLAEVRPSSPARHALQGLADELAERPPGARARRGGRRLTPWRGRARDRAPWT